MYKFSGLGNLDSSIYYPNSTYQEEKEFVLLIFSVEIIKTE